MRSCSDYELLLSTTSGRQWRRIGVSRRAGVAVPLFSVYSSRSVGIGDLLDLKLLVDWCVSCHMSIVQLLPMNDVGFNFRPYDAQSTFALDTVYLALEELVGIKTGDFKKEISDLKQRYPIKGSLRVDYGIKAAKLKLLWKIFNSVSKNKNPRLEDFMHRNAYWLTDYALFKVIKERNNERTWEGWSEDLKHRNSETIAVFKETYCESVLFFCWLQWQLSEQFKAVKDYARQKNVLIFGDLPFLVSRDSADVWSHQDYFKLDLASGAPPDMLYSKGQRWGMPPYQWDQIAAHHYDYLIEKIKYAQNFYDLYRIDHVVGIFRVWTIALSDPLENDGLNGVFDPPDENLWEEHGKTLLTLMVKNSDMLACAEDLGVVPDCSFKVLAELGIPGIDIQRWMRDWKGNLDFKKPQDYRKNALATISTHDMSNLCAWWKYEAGTVDEGLFERKCVQRGIFSAAIKKELFDLENSFYGRLRWKKEVDSASKMLEILKLEESSAGDFIRLYLESFDEKDKFLKLLGKKVDTDTTDYPLYLVKNALGRAVQSSSVFSIQLIYDWLSLGLILKGDPWAWRINFPGTMSDFNWTQILPVSLEEMLGLSCNASIKQINITAGRC